MKYLPLIALILFLFSIENSIFCMGRKNRRAYNKERQIIKKATIQKDSQQQSSSAQQALKALYIGSCLVTLGVTSYLSCSSDDNQDDPRKTLQVQQAFNMFNFFIPTGCAAICATGYYLFFGKHPAQSRTSLKPQKKIKRPPNAARAHQEGKCRRRRVSVKTK